MFAQADHDVSSQINADELEFCHITKAKGNFLEGPCSDDDL